MYSVKRSALVMHSDQQMFDLVNDIEAYPQFLPWCRSANILDSSESEISATIEIAYKGLNKSFTTRNSLMKPHKMNMQLIDGPFSELQGVYDFIPLDEGACKISLSLEFGFANKLIGAVIGPVFSQIADTMVDSFCRRADDKYGNK